MSSNGTQTEAQPGGRDPAHVIRMASSVGVITSDNLTAELLNVIKDQICKPRCRAASDAELAYFIGVCMRTQLDPFARQIYAIFRSPRRGEPEQLTVQTSIDGFRLIALRTREWEGAGDPEWCDDTGGWTDVWTKDGDPHAARVRVLRKGMREPVAGVAYWRLFHDTRSFLWQDGGPHMLAKCAEALALRRAFPQELSGLYTEDEMAQADVVDGTAVVLPTNAEPAAIPEALPADMLAALTRAAEFAGWHQGEGLAKLSMNLVDLGARDTSDPVAAIAQLTPDAGEELNRRISAEIDARETEQPENAEVGT